MYLHIDIKKCSYASSNIRTDELQSEKNSQLPCSLTSRVIELSRAKTRDEASQSILPISIFALSRLLSEAVAIETNRFPCSSILLDIQREAGLIIIKAKAGNGMIREIMYSLANIVINKLSIKRTLITDIAGPKSSFIATSCNHNKRYGYIQTCGRSTRDSFGGAEKQIGFKGE